ncbi:hypothetical protein C2845_PM09G08130 [Panicum miliaceum]|uniref:Uncharacterized protein n=1 Tax=Panicum miliaceum TaxID=4540 RepID=A0A3L6S2R0_PANMI|nr:hypothetical protein C2845_PM09G08130 [Panicum miliaceum]
MDATGSAADVVVVVAAHGRPAAQEILVAMEERMHKKTERIESHVAMMQARIHRFPWGLRGIGGEDGRYIVPSVVAIGPYHHGLPHLQEMEEVKHAAAHQFCRDAGRSTKEVYERILSLAGDARHCYAPDDGAVARLDDAELAAMLFLDGCFLLQYMSKSDEPMIKAPNPPRKSSGGDCLMGGKTKRTSAPTPMEIPPQQPLPIPPYGLSTWFPAPPTQSTFSAPWWHTGHQQLGLAGSSPQGFSWMPTPSISSQVVAENDDDSEVQAWGPNPYPPGGFMSFMNSTASPADLVSNESKSQVFNIAADDNGDNCDIEDKAIKSYEEEHKEEGPFMFKHCWEVLLKEPKWDAYLERLEDLEPDKRKFCEEEDVGKYFYLDDDADERPIGGKQAKEQRKKKKKGQPCIIDLEDELNSFSDAQKTANEGRTEMLETQRRVSSENLEARKLAHLAAKEHKESVMLETYRALLMKETTSMPEDVRSEHVLALKCSREQLFNKK